MENLKQEIVELAMLEMLNKNVSSRMNQLKEEYGKGELETQIRLLGFGCILKHYL